MFTNFPKFSCEYLYKFSCEYLLDFLKNYNFLNEIDEGNDSLISISSLKDFISTNKIKIY